MRDEREILFFRRGSHVQHFLLTVGFHWPITAHGDRKQRGGRGYLYRGIKGNGPETWQRARREQR